MIKKSIVVAGIIFAHINLSALSIGEAVDEVINTNPDVVAKVKEYNSLKNELEQSHSGYYPTLDLEAEAGYEEIKNSSTNYNTKGSSIDSTRIVLKENIFNGFGTQNLVEKSKAKLKSAKFEYLHSVNAKAYETIEVYLNILKSKVIADLSLQNIKVHQKVLSYIKEKIDNNVGKMSEYNRVSGRLAMANSKYILKQNDLKELVYALHKLLGRFVNIEELSKPKFDDTLLPYTLGDAINTFFNKNPQLQVAKSDLEAQRYELEISKQEYYPKVDLEVSKSMTHDLSGIDGREDDFKAVVKMKYNLFNGGYDYYEEQKNISDLYSQNEEEKKIIRAILNDTQLSWTGYEVIDKQMPSFRKNRFFMKKTLKAYREEYILGKRKLIDILDAENEYYNANVQLINAQFQLLLQKFKILKSQGTLYNDLKANTFLQDNNIDKSLVTKEDELPLNQEMDNDKIIDTIDICENSIKGTDVAKSGCDKKSTISYINTQLQLKKELNLKSSFVKSKGDLEVTKIELDNLVVLDYVTFDKDSTELSPKSKKIMRLLLSQLKKISPNNYIEISVVSNDYDDNEKNRVLSTKRAYSLKKNLLMNNVEANIINIFAIDDKQNGDKLNYVKILVASELDYIDIDFDKIENIDVNFEQKSLHLKAHSDIELKKLSKMFKNLGEATIEIVAYTNEYISSLKNEKLSQQRAEYIKEFMEKNIGKNIQFIPIGMGKYHENMLFDIQNENQQTNLVEFIIKQ